MLHFAVKSHSTAYSGSPKATAAFRATHSRSLALRRDAATNNAPIAECDPKISVRTFDYFFYVFFLIVCELRVLVIKKKYRVVTSVMQRNNAAPANNK